MIRVCSGNNAAADGTNYVGRRDQIVSESLDGIVRAGFSS